MKRLLMPLLIVLYLLFWGGTKSYAVSECKGDFDKNTWTNCVGTFTHANGAKYVGGFLDGMRHGQGTQFNADGSKYYVGEWKSDHWHGTGAYSQPSGEKYSGGWRNSMKHGYGRTFFADGDKYEGEYKDGLFHGEGVYSHADGRVRKGIWENSKFKRDMKSLQK